MGPLGLGLLQPNREAMAVIEDERPVSVFGLSFGVVVICFGLGLFYLGAIGKFTWVADAFGFGSDLVDASPGAVPVTGTNR